MLLYHPIVMITLEYCLESRYLDKITAYHLRLTLIKAKDFLLKSVREDGRFEPEIKNLHQYVISNVTTLVALKDKVEPEFEKILLRNVLKFWDHKKLYLCVDRKERLFNGDLYNNERRFFNRSYVLDGLVF